MENRSREQKELFLRQVHIRPVRMEDARPLQELRTSPGVREFILSTPSERSSSCSDFIAQLDQRDHVFVAELEQEGRNRLIGMAGLHIQNNLRERHCATMGMMVAAAHQGCGVGRLLMAQLLDLADNYLMLVRLELTVYPENTRAIALYASVGFAQEGVKRASVVRNGAYEDVLLMSRVRLPH